MRKEIWRRPSAQYLLVSNSASKNKNKNEHFADVCGMFEGKNIFFKKKNMSKKEMKEHSKKRVSKQQRMRNLKTTNASPVTFYILHE